MLSIVPRAPSNKQKLIIWRHWLWHVLKCTVHTCNVCPRAFADLRTDLGPGPRKQIAIFEPQPSEPKTFACNVKDCGRKFAWQAHFKYHQLTHTYVCFSSHNECVLVLLCDCVCVCMKLYVSLCVCHFVCVCVWVSLCMCVTVYILSVSVSWGWGVGNNCALSTTFEKYLSITTISNISSQSVWSSYHYKLLSHSVVTI